MRSFLVKKMASDLELGARDLNPRRLIVAVSPDCQAVPASYSPLPHYSPFV
jgi:hypothetical protein